MPILAFLIIISSITAVSVANPATTVYVDPKDIVNLSLTPGTSFYTNVSVSDVSNLWGYRVTLVYNRTILTATNFTSYSPFTDASPSSIDDSGNKTLRPNGNGQFKNWTGSFMNWDDITPDGDNSYVYTTRPNVTQTSQLQPPGVAPVWDRVKKVTVVFVARRTEPTGDEQMAPVIVVGGTAYNGTLVTPSESYVEYRNEWTTNPATGQAWTWSEINTLEAGVTSFQAGETWDGQLRVTQLYVLAESHLGWLTVTYSMPLGTEFGVSGDLHLFRIGFVVDDIGTSPLQLYVTDLTDPVSNSISHENVSGSFTNINVHDVVLKNLAASKTRIAVAGEPITINVTVSDDGDFNETFYVTLKHGDTIIDNQTDIFLDINETTTLTFTWDTTGATNGEYTVQAEAVTSQTDNYPDNNILNMEIRIGVIRDIAIISVTPTPAEVNVGESVIVAIIVKNQGNFSESVTIVAKYDNTTIGTDTIDAFPAGQSRTQSLSWTTEAIPQGTYKITAEAIVAVDDDPSNNVAESTPVKIGAGGIPFTWILGMVALLVIIILVIALYAILKIRKRRQKQPS